MNKLSIIIVNYNGIEFLPDCVKSVYDTVTVPCEIIVVDNNSRDGSARVIKALFREIHVIEQSSNLGFSKAANIGFKKSTGDCLLFLNPDTVLLRGSVDGMLKFLEAHPEIGILGPRILDRDGRVTKDGKGRSVNLVDDLLRIFLIDKVSDAFLSLFSILPLIGKMRLRYYEKSGRCERVSGSCLMASRAAFESFGGFDETIPMFLDDIDICRRSIESGRINYYLAEASVIHKKQMSIKGLKNYKMFDLLSMKAHIFYYRKHFCAAHVLVFKAMAAASIPYLLLLDMVSLPYFLIAGKMPQWRQILLKHARYVYVITEADIERKFLQFDEDTAGK